MSKGHKANLIEGKVWKKLLMLTLPMMVGMVGMVIFNLVDTYFVGQLGTLELAAMGYTLPVVMIQASISMGLGVGASAAISRAIGEGKHQHVKRLTTDSLFLSVSIVVVLITIGLLTLDPLFRALGAEGRTLELVKEYMFIWYIGIPFVVVPMVGNNAIRAAGNTFVPSMVMVTAIIVNIILDPLLIFGLGPFPAMGIKGAALATVVARATTLCLSLTFLRFKFDMLTAAIPPFKEVLNSWKTVLYIGVPAALTQLILPVSTGVVIRMVSKYGDVAVAGMTVGSRVEMLALSPLLALSAVIIPFVGQNLGAGRPRRVKEGIFYCNIFSLVLGALMFVILFPTAPLIAPIFNPDPEVVKTGILYLTIVSVSFGLNGVIICGASIFNAFKKPLYAAIVNLIKMILLYIPLAFLGSYLFGLKGIFYGAALSSVIGGVVVWIWLSREAKSHVIHRPAVSAK